MSLKRLSRMVGLVGLCLIVQACSTGSYQGQANLSGESSAKLGERYLLGQGVQKDDAKAFSYFLQAANSGDPFAANEVAYLYAAGKGTSQNYANALIWYQKAANSDLASAQYNLGLMYRYGLGTPVNHALAMQWIRKAASHGFEPAKRALS